MKKVIKLTIKSLLLVILSFCVLGIINTYAGEPIFKITGISVKGKSAGVTVNDVDLTSGEVTNDVTFTDVTDYITYDLKLKNTSEDDYIIKSISDNNSSEYLNYSYGNYNNLVVKAGTEEDIDLTITYVKQATNPELSLGSTTISITYEKVVINPDTGDVTPSGDTNTDEVTPSNNPKTNDNVKIYFILSSLSIIGLIVLSKDKKKSKLLLIGLITLIPLYAKANTLQLTVKFNNTLKAVSYEVEIDLGNGSSIIYKTLAKGAKLTRPSNPSKRGYTFDDWYSNNSVYDFDTQITEPISLEARFTKDTYTLTYDLDGGSLEYGKSNPDSYDIDSDITLFEPSKEGYVFAGWKLSTSDEVVKPLRIYDEVGNKSYKAIYTPENYVITFNPNNGDETFTINADYGTTITAPSNPTKTGFTFSYWSLNDAQYSFNTTITGPITLVANYTPNGDTAYTIYHRYRHLNDSGFDTETQVLHGETGAEVTLPFKEKTGFDNPSTSKTLTIAATGDASEEYIYERTMYSLNVTDRSTLTNQSTINGSYPFGSTISLISGGKEGHTFAGWRLSGSESYISEETTYEFTIDSNVTITPEYNPITYHILLDPANGESKINQYVNYGEKIIKPETNPSKNGYKFTNWYFGENVYDFNTLVTGEVELVAHYTPEVYNIYYVNASGVSNPSTYTIEDEFTLNNPSKDGYTFDGWSTNLDDTIIHDITVSNQYGEITYIAHFTANTNTPYQVIHKYENLPGSIEPYDVVIDNLTGTTDDEVTALVKNKTGFTLVGEQGTVVILGTGDASKEYTYNRVEYTLNVTNRDNLDNSSSANGTYKYGQTITLKANDVTGYTFKGWKLSGENSYISTDKTYSFNIEGNVSIAPDYQINSYDISFDPNNNSDPITYDSVIYGSTITKPEDPTPLNGYKFDFWSVVGSSEEYDFTTLVSNNIDLIANYSLINYDITYDLDGGSLEEGKLNPTSYNINSNITLYNPNKAGYDFAGWTINDDTVLYPTINIQNQTGNVKYTAHYEEQVAAPAICRKVITRTQETCTLTDTNKGCHAAGFATGEVISYGNIVSSDTYNVGDVFECDVTGNGDYKRFYYLRTLDDKAVLISNNNFEGASGQNNANNYTYYEALTKLPNASTQWTNLPVTFTHDGDDTVYAARFVTFDDLETAAGTDDLKAAKSLKDLPFLYENIGKYTTSSGRSTVWLEAVNENNELKGYRYHVDSLDVQEGLIEATDNKAASKNCVRPVIEVPLNRIDDSYIVRFDANGGSVSEEYRIVPRGSKLGALPTATSSQYIFGNWYTSQQFTQTISEDTKPSGYDTYYAKWLNKVTDAVINKDSFNIQEGESDSIVVLNAATIEPYTFSSNDESIATVDQNGTITAVNNGTTTIVITGNKSGTSKEVTVHVIAYSNHYDITLDFQDGRDNEVIQIEKGNPISGLPTPTRSNYTFVGWYETTDWLIKVEDGDAINSNLELYARWMANDSVAEMNRTYYSSIQTAIDEAPASTKTTITVLKDVTITSMINMLSKNNDKNIELDLNGHKLEITKSNANINLFRTAGKLEVKNGTLKSNTTKGVIDVMNSTGKLVVTNATIENTGQRQAINNEGGLVEIGSGAIIKSNATGEYFDVKRGTLQNNSGTTRIIGGTIINSGGTAISLKEGNLTIGTKDGISFTDIPMIQGASYGVSSATTAFEFYDGVIKGAQSCVEVASTLPDSNIEEGYIKNETTELIDTVQYHVLSLVKNNTPGTITVHLQANGGEVSTNIVEVEEGNTIDALPEPTKGIYTFAGWYIDEELQTPVSYPITPNDGDIYYAKWVYNANENIVEFRTTNDAMVEYYSKIDSWKTSSSNFPTWSSSNKSPDWALDAIENTAMKNNFDANNCECTQDDVQCVSSGTVLCDKPKGYSTAIDDSITVYLSDINKTKGDSATYVKVIDGTIYNTIPGQIYRWELDSDPNVYGYFKTTSERRILETGDLRNTRDLGGLPVDSDDDGIVDSHLDYGRLIRGIKLKSSSSVEELTNLGITEQLDLRESNSDAYRVSKYKNIEAQNYYVSPYSGNSTEFTYYAMTRAAVKYAMEEIVKGENLYFHCRIGADRTGTVAYILEGLLGVPEEDRIEDYELSFFYGLIRIHRYHDEKPGSSVGTGKERFVYMHNLMPTNDQIYDWYMEGSQNEEEDEKLIDDFRKAMIVKNS